MKFLRNKTILFPFFLSLNLYATDLNELHFVTEPSGVIYYDKKNIELKGIVGERIQYLIKKLELKNKVEIMPWSRAYYETIKNKNYVIFPIAKTEEREKELKYCCIISKSRQFFFKLKARKDINVKNITDVKKYSVGVVRDDYRQVILEKKGLSKLEVATTMDLNFKKFIGGREDIILLSENSMLKYLNQNNMTINEIEKLIEFKDIDINNYVAFNKEMDDKIISKVKTTLKEVYDPDKDL
ncbi:transporter substrate-binding domain-containing protein [Pigmentibacter sp. JX0631]|uniref:substrate-binding periplasmic protein n=1 Tax=Pigmentibacter sp. JX0631 TaxID=2976982 RepID=UPI0024696B69|nr:transporter substrate-binding domain-containing protein [Pigmentibacter sp. JX0631]WGL59800.1 transporter substrate-binding domain-containing protein [Pigmentibacter sp. JX0631]